MKFKFLEKFKIKKYQIIYLVAFKLLKYAVVYFIFVSFFSCKYNPELSYLTEDYVLYIEDSASYSTVFDSLKPRLKNEGLFDFYAEKLGLNKSVKSGKYDLKKGSNAINIITKLVAGKQDQQKIIIRNHKTIYEFSGSISKQIQADSTQILEAILEYNYPDLQKNRQENLKFYFLPDTYFVWWNINPENFVKKMVDYNQQFWTNDRIEKAEKLRLTPKEVYTLASIVQSEASVSDDEQKKVAKAYINRMRKGMKLQSDPTAVYGSCLAKGFGKINRVYASHTKFNSPYNTYIYKGLPPGPICMPNPSAIDAVLEPDTHNYIYFSAKPGNSGTHFFTNNIRAHENNANKYRSWLNKNKIK